MDPSITEPTMTNVANTSDKELHYTRCIIPCVGLGPVSSPFPSRTGLQSTQPSALTANIRLYGDSVEFLFARKVCTSLAFSRLAADCSAFAFCLSTRSAALAAIRASFSWAYGYNINQQQANANRQRQDFNDHTSCSSFAFFSACRSAANRFARATGSC